MSITISLPGGTLVLINTHDQFVAIIKLQVPEENLDGNIEFTKYQLSNFARLNNKTILPPLGCGPP